MDREPKIHFRIHWSKKKYLEWEAFDTRHEAMTRALEVATPGELFTIETFSSTYLLRGPKAALAHSQKTLQTNASQYTLQHKQSSAR